MINKDLDNNNHPYILKEELIKAIETIMPELYEPFEKMTAERILKIIKEWKT
jgi:hypothetical protein